MMLEVVFAHLAGNKCWPLVGAGPAVGSGWLDLVDSEADVRAGRNPYAVAGDGDACGRRYLLEGVV
jgi:hypothetical protein